VSVLVGNLCWGASIVEGIRVFRGEGGIVSIWEGQVDDDVRIHMNLGRDIAAERKEAAS